VVSWITGKLQFKITYLKKILHIGPTHWEGKCKTGKVQSPVDFNSDNIKENKTQIRLRFNQNYFDVQQMFYLKNNGHTGEMSIKQLN
jgi:carbonic anhydrase